MKHNTSSWFRILSTVDMRCKCLLPVCVSDVYMYLTMTVCLSICVCVWCVRVCVSVCLYVCLSLSVYLCLCVCRWEVVHSSYEILGWWRWWRYVMSYSTADIVCCSRTDINYILCCGNTKVCLSGICLYAQSVAQIVWTWYTRSSLQL